MVFYLGYSVPLPLCIKVVYRVRYAVSVLVTSLYQTPSALIKGILHINNDDNHDMYMTLLGHPLLPRGPFMEFGLPGLTLEVWPVELDTLSPVVKNILLGTEIQNLNLSGKKLTALGKNSDFENLKFS